MSIELFDAMMERLAELEENELAANITQAEDEFSSGQFISIQEAVIHLEKQWQQETAD